MFKILRKKITPRDNALPSLDARALDKRWKTNEETT